MFVPIVTGVRRYTEVLFTHRAFCGRCVEVTPHKVHRIFEEEHVYFVSIGAPDCTEVSVCDACALVVGCRAEKMDREADDPWGSLPEEVRARRETDAFLWAHAGVSTEVRWTARVIAMSALILIVLGGIGWLTAWLFRVGIAACGLVLGLAPVALFAHRELARRAIERDVARELEPRVARLLARTGGTLRDLAPRARILRLAPLARALESLVSTPRAGGPYR